MNAVTTEETTAQEKELIGRLQDAYTQIREALSKKIVGQEAVIDQIMISLFAGGHCLLVGVPGLAKTLIISTLSQLVDLKFNRIQFTPDLMPSDITGTEVIGEDAEATDRMFKFLKGPIFANVILADEINRTPPKTQAALMEAMEEFQVTAAGVRYELERPFFVLATQNPIEQEGTYPLPAAQLDRFMLNILVDYPEEDEEYDIIRYTTTNYDAKLEPVLKKDQIVDLLGVVRKVRIPEDVLTYATTFGRLTRISEPDADEFCKEWLAWGAGPRAAQALIIGGKARAMLHGRFEVTHEDVRSIIFPVFRHRLICNYHAEAEGIDTDTVIEHILMKVPAPNWPPKKVEKKKGFLARLLGGGGGKQ